MPNFRETETDWAIAYTRIIEGPPLWQYRVHDCGDCHRTRNEHYLPELIESPRIVMSQRFEDMDDLGEFLDDLEMPEEDIEDEDPEGCNCGMCNPTADHQEPRSPDDLIANTTAAAAARVRRTIDAIRDGATAADALSWTESVDPGTPFETFLGNDGFVRPIPSSGSIAAISEGTGGATEEPEQRTTDVSDDEREPRLPRSQREPSPPPTTPPRGLDRPRQTRPLP